MDIQNIIHRYHQRVQLLVDTDFTNSYINTLLLWSVIDNRLDVAKYLISRNGDVNAKNWKGETPLFIACSRGYEDIVKFLLTRKDIEINTVTSLQMTPFYIACYNNQLNIVKQLLERNDLDINFIDKYGNSALLLCAQLEHNQIIREILQHRYFTKKNIHTVMKNHSWYEKGIVQQILSFLPENVDLLIMNYSGNCCFDYPWFCDVFKF